MKKILSILFIGLSVVFLNTSCASNLINKARDAESATDGKVLGVINDEAAASALDHVGLHQEAKWLRDQAEMAKFWNSVPSGMKINIEYRLKSTKQIIGLNDIERRVWFSNISDFTLPKPDYGKRVNVEIVTPPDIVPDIVPDTTTIDSPSITNTPPVSVVVPPNTNAPNSILDGPDNAIVK